MRAKNKPIIPNVFGLPWPAHRRPGVVAVAEPEKTFGRLGPRPAALGVSRAWGAATLPFGMIIVLRSRRRLASR